MSSALDYLGELPVDGRHAVADGVESAQVVGEKLTLDEVEGQHVAAPAILHLHLLAALFLRHHVWVDPLDGVEALGLDGLEVGLDALPGVVEDLVGVIGVHQLLAPEPVEDLPGEPVLLGRQIDERGLVDELVIEPLSEVGEPRVVGVQVPAHGGAAPHGLTHVLGPEANGRAASRLEELVAQAGQRVPVVPERIDLGDGNAAEHRRVDVPGLGKPLTSQRSVGC